MKLYWVSLIVQNTYDIKPWLCSISDPCTSLEEALECVKFKRNNYRVISAWIDTLDDKDIKTTVFNKCYINALGRLSVD